MHIGSVMIAATFALAITLDAADARRGGGGGGFRGGGGFGGGMRAGGGFPRRRFQRRTLCRCRTCRVGHMGWQSAGCGYASRLGWRWLGGQSARLGAAVAGQEIVPVGAADGRATDRVGEEVGGRLSRLGLGSSGGGSWDRERGCLGQRLRLPV